VTLAVHLSALAKHSDSAELEVCRQELDGCIDTLRDFARGVYPPVLATRGLGAAVRAHVRDQRTGTDVVGTGVAALRFSPGPEAAVYFCCLEALQNIAKHAPRSRSWVLLEWAASTLTFEVGDDGPGFDAQAAHEQGSGLLGMTDRLAAAGGTLTVCSQPGRGTRIIGVLPADPIRRNLDT